MVVVLGVFWNVAGVLLIFGRGGWSTWSGLECTRSACGAWAWYVGVRGVFWNVVGVRVIGGSGTWEYLAWVVGLRPQAARKSILQTLFIITRRCDKKWGRCGGTWSFLECC